MMLINEASGQHFFIKQTFEQLLARYKNIFVTHGEGNKRRADKELRKYMESDSLYFIFKNEFRGYYSTHPKDIPFSSFLVEKDKLIGVGRVL